MNAMHYAVYFDAAEIVTVLAEQNPSLVMSTCSEFSNGSSLHLAATNLCLDSAKVLVSGYRMRSILFSREDAVDLITLCKFLLFSQLQNGADGSATDDNGRQPYELIPDSKSLCLISDRRCSII